jgi:hypothetical protein
MGPSAIIPRAKQTQGRDPIYLDTKTPNLGSHGSKKNWPRGSWRNYAHKLRMHVPNKLLKAIRNLYVFNRDIDG